MTECLTCGRAVSRDKHHIHALAGPTRETVGMYGLEAFDVNDVATVHTSVRERFMRPGDRWESLGRDATGATYRIAMPWHVQPEIEWHDRFVYRLTLHSRSVT
jgi:hypothetical protein